MLKPERFDAEPGKASSEQDWSHFKRTFDYFVQHFTGDRTFDDAKTLAALTNCLKSTVFFYISAATTYGDVIKILKDTYTKPRNEVYSRHMLSSRQQQEHESVDGFTHAIDLLAKECTFVDMNANDYRDEFICDSFIREL